MRPIQIVAVAGDAVLLRKLVSLFDDMPECMIVGEASTAAELAGHPQLKRANLILIDHEMVQASDGKLPADLARLDARVVVLVERRDMESECELLSLGAAGVLPRGASADHCKKALHAVATGELWYSRKALHASLRLFRGQVPRLSAPVDCLTARELQVAEYVSSGATNKEVARLLDISERTVKAHLCSVYGKLNVKRRGQLHDALLLRLADANASA